MRLHAKNDSKNTWRAVQILTLSAGTSRRKYQSVVSHQAKSTEDFWMNKQETRQRRTIMALQRIHQQPGGRNGFLSNHLHLCLAAYISIYIHFFVHIIYIFCFTHRICMGSTYTYATICVSIWLFRNTGATQIQYTHGASCIILHSPVHLYSIYIV